MLGLIVATIALELASLSVISPEFAQMPLIVSAQAADASRSDRRIENHCFIAISDLKVVGASHRIIPTVAFYHELALFDAIMRLRIVFIP
jgi:hypothetical protein